MSVIKEPGFIPYKFRSLKVYASTEWLAGGKKKYRKVFEADETSYLYAEFAFFNKLFDEEDWEVKVRLRCYTVASEGDNRAEQVCNIELNRKVRADENIVYIREGWGNATANTLWKRGEYIWEAWLDGVKIGQAKCYIEDQGPISTLSNPYFSLRSLRLFEGPTRLPPRTERTYYTKFKQSETRYIWGEFTIKNTIRDRSWFAEVVFNFYNDARQLKGRTTELVQIFPHQSEVEVCSGWGSDTMGTWYGDNYTLEIVFMEQLVAIVPFEVGQEFLKGETQAMLPGTQPLVEGEDLPAEKTLDDLLAELDALIGLESIKKRIRDYIQYLGFLKIRKEKGFEEEAQFNLHAIFTGNPGTGKTTVAKMLGQIYQRMGLLERGHVHEVDRADLVGEFIGQTAPKVKEAIKKAEGGILFLDEAYALARSSSDQKDYGREVIEILLKEMSDGHANIAVLAAGYPEEMSTFLDSNPGLKSRFNMTFEFPDYSPNELFEIALYAMDQRAVRMTEEGKTVLKEKLVEAYRNRDRSFGNARMVNGIVDEAKMNMGLRVMQDKEPEDLTEEDLATIRLEDVEKIFGKKDSLSPEIPVDQALLDESLRELNEMVGLSNVKGEIQELVKLVKFYREIGKNVLHNFHLHSVFTGNPGTGKTTVARILAKIFKALGILERGHLVEADRSQLVGGYVGQTAIRTAERIDAAIGGVLFIDEAYALTSGAKNNDFGQEAIEIILKRMEDDRGQLVVIVAGYPKQMKWFLESNPGLKSRFDKHFHFDDYDPKDMWKIARLMLRKEGLEASKDAQAHLEKYFHYLHRHRDRFFGNARAVRKVVSEAIRNQHLRLATLDPEARSRDMLATLTLEDVNEFQPDGDQLINGNQNRIGFRGND